MARLIYSAICSLDGYIEDGDGRFDWARPDDELLALLSGLERPVGTHLYGRRIERAFEPDGIRALKERSGADMAVAGTELAGQAIAAGLVDELQLFLNPIVVGGGKRALPDGVRTELELLEERRLASGVVYLGYQLRR
jgi:dihydrofolate reductase